MNSFIRRLAGQTAVYGLSSILGRFLNYLLVPLYTNIFNPSEYGVVTELYAYSSFLIIIFTYGMETTFFRFVSEEKKYNEVYSTSLISILISSLFFVIILGFAIPGIAVAIGYHNQMYLLWLLLFIIITDAIMAIPFARLRNENKAWIFALLKLTNILIAIMLNLFFLLLLPKLNKHFILISYLQNLNLGVGYVFVSNLIANLITLALFSRQMVRLTRFNFELWKQMMIYAIPLLIAGLGGMINETFDRAMMKYLIKDKQDALYQLGIYGANYKISILMTLFIQTFRYAAEPFFFNTAKEKNVKEMYADIMKYFIIFGLFIFLLVMLFLHYIQYFIGYEFRVGLKVVPILLMANLFLGIFFNLSIWYKLTNKTIYGAYLTLFGAAITIILNIILIPLMGYIGAAWTTLTCYVAMAVLSYLIGNKYYKVNYPLGEIAFYFILSIILYWLSTLFTFDRYWQKSLLGIFFILLFLVIVYLRERKRFIRYDMESP